MKMDYKRIIKSQPLRFAILRFLSLVPDAIMLRFQYRIKFGRWPNLKHPKRFTEKLQLYKMKYRNPVMHQCVDKYEVRKYIEGKGLGTILNRLYGVYERPEDIDFDALPNQFVMKTTTGSGGQNVIIVKDKTSSNINELRRKLRKWNGANNLGALSGREWAYYTCKPRIVVEDLLNDSSVKDSSLTDYKFFCFNGEPKCVQIDTGRYDGHRQNYYDMQWRSLGVHCTYPEGKSQPVPIKFDVMKRYAAQLSADFPFVRVDFYNVNGAIYFGELTFYPSSGYGEFHPDSFDFQLGSLFDIF
jgi:hypothetical protein